MKSALVASLPMLTAGMFSKDTYAMSHPFAFKEFMETYFPTAENLVQANNTDSCVEWVKLCIDDGEMTSCGGPFGNNFQIHAVGAYMRESGTKSMEEMESEFSKSMGDLSKYDPMMENHVAFLTTDLAYYTSAFDAGQVPYFSSTFSDSSQEYESILIQVPGSLATGAKSMINMEIVATASSVLGGQVHQHSMPRVSQLALEKAHAHLSAAPRQVSIDGKPVLVKLHRSFASSDLDRDTQYFEQVWMGSKVSSSSDDQGKSYSGLLVSGDVMEVRYMQPSLETQGPTSVKEWEAYQVNLHNTCFDSTNNQGFDRLADNHLGDALGRQSGASVDAYLEAQISYGLPFRFYGQPTNPWFYLYGPNGWGLQIIGPCNSHPLCPTIFTNYNMCTQGITGDCQHDQDATQVV